MNQEQQDAANKEKRKRGALGFFLVLIPIICIFLIIELWPVIDNGKAGAANNTQYVEPGKKKAPSTEEMKEDVEGKQTVPTTEQNDKNRIADGEKNNSEYKTSLIFKWAIPFQLRMILLVLLAGALGSYIHMATSFGYFIGMGEFKMTWYWWYWLRLPIGAVLALIFSMLVQGGVFVVPTEGTGTNPATVVGVAGLIGMFSRSAIDKLRDIFDIVFKPPEKEDGKPENGNNNNNETEKPGSENETEDKKGGKKPDKPGK